MPDNAVATGDEVTPSTEQEAGASTGHAPVGLLSKASLLAKGKQTRTRDVYVAAVGASVRVRGLTSKERDEYEKSLQKKVSDGKGGVTVERDLTNFRAKLVVWGAVNGDGTQMFGYPEDIKTVGDLDAGITSPLFDAISELSGMTKADVEEMEQSLGNARNGDSSSN